MIFAIKYYFPSTATRLGGTFKTRKANWLAEFHLQFNKTKFEQTDKRKH